MRIRFREQRLDLGIIALVGVIYLASALLIGTHVSAGVLGTSILDCAMAFLAGGVYMCCVFPYRERRAQTNREQVSMLGLGLLACAAGSTTVGLIGASRPVPELGYAMLTLTLAPLAEELLFRGLLLPYLLDRFPWYISVLATAGIFALLHGTSVQAYSCLVLGLACGLFYASTRKIWPCIAMHVLYNFFMLFIQPMVGVRLVPAIVLNAAFVVGLIAFVWHKHGKL